MWCKILVEELGGDSKVKKAIAVCIVLAVTIAVTFKCIVGNRDVVTPKKITVYDNTDVYSVLNVPMEDKNMVWCGAMNLAWNELRDNIVKEDVKLNGESGLLEELNRKPFTKENLSEKDYIAIAGYGKDGIVNKINKMIKEKFHESDQYGYKKSVAPNDFLAYSFLKKDINFKNAFEVVKDGMNFKGKKVDAFGIDRVKGEKQKKLKSQIELLSYNNDDDFIIRLISGEENEELVVAKIPPKKSFNETLDYALNNRNKINATIEKFKMPMLAFEAQKSFKELMGRKLLNKGFEQYKLEEVYENILFTLTEKGAKLKAEAAVNGDGATIRKQNLNLIVDKSFLIYMKEVNKNKPYFVLWVNNNEIMVDKPR